MIISNLTAMTIQNRDDLVITHAGPDDSGKYTGWITYPPEQYCRPFLNTEAIFDSPELAEQHMRDLMAEVRELDNISIAV